jgi:hypothetical protein
MRNKNYILSEDELKELVIYKLQYEALDSEHTDTDYNLVSFYNFVSDFEKKYKTTVMKENDTIEDVLDNMARAVIKKNYK